MKKLILVLFLFTALHLFGQPISGSKLKANFPVATDINGKTIDVEAWLQQGKVVVIDVFATWCPPCWTDYKNKILQTLYTNYGPLGTDKIKLVSVEGDMNTTVNQIKGIGANTQGDWTQNVTYPIVNDNGKISDFLSITYFPTLIVVRPDRTLLNVSSELDNRTLALNFAVKSERDFEIGNFNIHNSITFCNDIEVNEKFTFINLGLKPITSATFDVVKSNKVLKTIEIKKQIGVFEYFDVEVKDLVINTNSSFYLNNTSINNEGVPLEMNRAFFIYQKTNIVNPKFKIAFTTDNFPGETSWELRDENNKLITSKKYNAGPGTGGSGGPDASKVHEHVVELKTTQFGCLSLIVKDAGNNGMTSNPGTIRAGVEVYDNNNLLIKAKLRNEFVFTNQFTAYLNASMVSATQQLLTSKEIGVSPNPASNFISVSVPEGMDRTMVSIFGSDGKCVLPIQSLEENIDISDMKGGLYLLHLFENGRLIYCTKFIKVD